MKGYILTILVAILATANGVCQSEDYAVLIKQGMKALEQDSIEKAENLLLKAIDIKPADKSSAVLYQYLGQLRARQNRHAEAMEAFNSGLELMPESESLLMDRISLNIQTGNEARAMNDLNELLTRNPDHAEGLFFRAFLYTEQYLYNKARIDYERLVVMQPRNRDARLGLALLCDKDKRPKEAMEHMDVLVRYWPEDATVYAIRGGMHQKRRQYEQALADLNLAIELEPDNADFYISRALLYKDFKKKALATADFRRAIELGASAEECAAMMGEGKK